MEQLWLSLGIALDRVNRHRATPGRAALADQRRPLGRGISAVLHVEVERARTSHRATRRLTLYERQRNAQASESLVSHAPKSLKYFRRSRRRTDELRRRDKQLSRSPL